MCRSWPRRDPDRLETAVPPVEKPAARIPQPDDPDQPPPRRQRHQRVIGPHAARIKAMPWRWPAGKWQDLGAEMPPVQRRRRDPQQPECHAEPDIASGDGSGIGWGRMAVAEGAASWFVAVLALLLLSWGGHMANLPQTLPPRYERNPSCPQWQSLIPDAT